MDLLVDLVTGSPCTHILPVDLDVIRSVLCCWIRKLTAISDRVARPLRRTELVTPPRVVLWTCLLIRAQLVLPGSTLTSWPMSSLRASGRTLPHYGAGPCCWTASGQDVEVVASSWFSDAFCYVHCTRFNCACPVSSSRITTVVWTMPSLSGLTVGTRRWTSSWTLPGYIRISGLLLVFTQLPLELHTLQL